MKELKDLGVKVIDITFNHIPLKDRVNLKRRIRGAKRIWSRTYPTELYRKISVYFGSPFVLCVSAELFEDDDIWMGVIVKSDIFLFESHLRFSEDDEEYWPLYRVMNDIVMETRGYFLKDARDNNGFS